jgi:hypothetical protein
MPPGAPGATTGIPIHFTVLIGPNTTSLMSTVLITIVVS